MRPPHHVVIDSIREVERLTKKEGDAAELKSSTEARDKAEPNYRAARMAHNQTTVTLHSTEAALILPQHMQASAAAPSTAPQQQPQSGGSQQPSVAAAMQQVEALLRAMAKLCRGRGTRAARWRRSERHLACVL